MADIPASIAASQAIWTEPLSILLEYFYPFSPRRLSISRPMSSHADTDSPDDTIHSWISQ